MTHIFLLTPVSNHLQSKFAAPAIKRWDLSASNLGFGLDLKLALSVVDSKSGVVSGFRFGHRL